MSFVARLLYLDIFICTQLLLKTEALIYRVVTVPDSPFNVVKKGHHGGKIVYEGFIIDLLKEIDISSIDMDFVVSLASDRKYGAKDSDGNWDGMIGNLVRNESDIAASVITVTAERASVVKFSLPILRGGYRILVKKPGSENRVLQRAIVLLHPFGTGVWLAIAISCTIVSFVLLVIGRFNPAQEEEGIYENSQMATTAFYILFSLLFLQGSRLTQSSAAGRILMCFWWLFVVMTIAVYVSSLGSFLFLTSPAFIKPLPFYSFEQMANQKQFQYGILNVASYYKRFDKKKGTLESKIYNYFNDNKDVIVETMRKGVERVKSENYAMITETISAHYIAAHDCDLTVVGEQMFDIDYSFACRADSDICSKLDVEIIRLKENGFINKLMDRWMSGQCSTYGEVFSQTTHIPPIMSQYMTEKAVDLAMFTFPLVWLATGIVISVITLVTEIFCAGRK